MLLCDYLTFMFWNKLHAFVHEKYVMLLSLFLIFSRLYNILLMTV